ncbi:unnamed protein product [Paramecium octaurelia]|uniref:Uncharacterized protein n=1 Tax=Paramecium octaurelia TaxID=43137 RepID=A0A8S1RX06_PAROT|nr:unnamed protein product [Paramecium octaurelia]
MNWNLLLDDKIKYQNSILFINNGFGISHSFSQFFRQYQNCFFFNKLNDGNTKWRIERLRIRDYQDCEITFLENETFQGIIEERFIKQLDIFGK